MYVRVCVCVCKAYASCSYAIFAFAEFTPSFFCHCSPPCMSKHIFFFTHAHTNMCAREACTQGCEGRTNSYGRVIQNLFKAWCGTVITLEVSACAALILPSTSDLLEQHTLQAAVFSVFTSPPGVIPDWDVNIPPACVHLNPEIGPHCILKGPHIGLNHGPQPKCIYKI